MTEDIILNWIGSSGEEWRFGFGLLMCSRQEQCCLLLPASKLCLQHGESVRMWRCVLAARLAVALVVMFKGRTTDW